MPRKNFGQYIHDKLAEPDGQQFVMGKFRFWLPAVLFLSVLNAVLTALIFKNDAQENYISPIMVSVAGLLGWLAIGCLHYSDSTDRQLSRGVSALDSITLLFVTAHFCGLLYIYGHATTLRSAEAKYTAAAEKFNAEAKQVSTDNVEIAKAAQAIARETTKAEKLRNDTAYQQRKAAEAGGGILRSAPAVTVAPGLATSAVELERPTKPTESSAAFLTRWDWLVRLANFGELALACLTLIFIRNVSAKSNAPTTTQPQELPSVFAQAYRSPVARPAFTKTTTQSDTVSRQSVEHKETTQGDTAALREGLKVLRETLRDIAFYTPGVHYKCDLKPDCVWIRQMTSDSGIQRTGHGAKARHSILRAALKMEPERYRAEVEAWLSENGFEL